MGMLNSGWFFLAKRTNVPILPVWHKVQMDKKVSETVYRANIHWVAYWKGNKTLFYFHNISYQQAINAVNNLLLYFDKTMDHLARTEELCKKAKEIAKYFYKNNLENLSNEELLNKYNELIKIYKKSFSYGFITWCIKPFQEKALNILKKYNLDEKTVFGELVKFEDETDYIKKEKELDILAVIYKESGNIPEKAIKNFLERYKWVGYDYAGPELSYEEVVDIIKEREIKEPTKSNKVEILNLLTSEEKEIFEAFSKIAYTKDIRNLSEDFIHFCLDFFYREVGRRYDLTLKQVRYLWPEELENMLKHNITYSKEYLNKKIGFCAAESHQDLNKYMLGDLAKTFLENKSIVLEKKVENVAEIKGTVASPGKIKAAAKIIEVPKDQEKLKQGEILVTHMTSPRFMAAISRSSAIVTDEGGLTCHAAIIARELKKPCIIGTKIATKVLKDGCLIEVDANVGVIKIL